MRSIIKDDKLYILAPITATTLITLTNPTNLPNSQLKSQVTLFKTCTNGGLTGGDIPLEAGSSQPGQPVVFVVNHVRDQIDLNKLNFNPITNPSLLPDLDHIVVRPTLECK